MVEHAPQGRPIVPEVGRDPPHVRAILHVRDLRVLRSTRAEAEGHRPPCLGDRAGEAVDLVSAIGAAGFAGPRVHVVGFDEIDAPVCP